MQVYVTPELECPTCKSPEVNNETGFLFIRGHKVYDGAGRAWSQCLVCAGYYDNDKVNGRNEDMDKKKGWFTCD